MYDFFPVIPVSSCELIQQLLIHSFDDNCLGLAAKTNMSARPNKTLGRERARVS